VRNRQKKGRLEDMVLGEEGPSRVREEKSGDPAPKVWTGTEADSHNARNNKQRISEKEGAWARQATIKRLHYPLMGRKA